VAALGANQPGDVLVQHRLHRLHRLQHLQHLQHLQPHPNRQREQALPSGAGKLGNRDGDRGG
jgi:hypothetical protein